MNFFPRFLPEDTGTGRPGLEARLHAAAGVVAIPNSVFYDDPAAGRSQVRFAFCETDDVLDEAASRLRHLAS
jgi:aspartate/methionine/tyrosine aminotransferase